MNLCPICDKKLVGNICPSCKKLIRNPLVIPDGIRLNESHYGNDDMCEFHANDRHIPFLNQRHPEREPECSYHDPDFKEKLPKQPSAGRSTILTQRTRSGKNLSGLVIAIAIFYIIACLAMSLFSLFSNIHI